MCNEFDARKPNTINLINQDEDAGRRTFYSSYYRFGRDENQNYRIFKFSIILRSKSRNMTHLFGSITLFCNRDIN